MNRTLLVSLIKKNIDELILLTEGFETMSEYPAAIIMLAKNKTDDIKAYIDQLGTIKNVIIAPAAINTEATPVLIEADKKDDEPTENWQATDLWQESLMHEKEREERKEDKQSFIDQLEQQKESAFKVELNDEKEADDLNDVELTEAIEHTEVIKVIDDIQLLGDTETTEEIEDEVEIIHASYIPDEIEETPKTESISVEKKMTIAEKMTAQTITRNEFHAKKDTNAVNDSIAHKKVEDIRHAISLGDRFRFQRELFHNNGEEMNKMLSYINLLASYDEIVSFLQSKYGWSEDNSTANDFYQLIKRKF